MREKETKETYNGWKNYETWVTKLWLDNDEYSYRRQKEWVVIAQAEIEKNPSDVLTGKEQLVRELGDLAKIEIECIVLNELTDTASLATDLLQASFSMVDFYEIAENILEEIE